MKNVKNLVLVLMLSLMATSVFSQSQFTFVSGMNGNEEENVLVSVWGSDGIGDDTGAAYVSGNDAGEIVGNTGITFVVSFKRPIDISSFVFSYGSSSLDTLKHDLSSIYKGLTISIASLDELGGIGLETSGDYNDFVDGVCNKQFNNITGIRFRYDERLNYDNTLLTFNMNGTLSEVYTPDDVAILNNKITELELLNETLNATNTNLTDSIVVLNNTIAELNDSIVGLNTTVDALFTATDTATAYNNGWDIGYDLGVVSVDTLVFYNNGYAQGLLDCDGTSYIDNGSDDELNVYPNPLSNNSTLYIETDNLSFVEVYSTSGSLLLSTTEPQFNLSGFNKGLYLVRVYNDNGTYLTKKITVE